MFIEKRAFDIEQFLLSEFNARHIGRSSDISGSLYRYLTGTSNVSGLDVICRIRYGTVIESFPFLNCYRVSLEGGSHVMCSYLGGPSSLPFGAKEASLLMPGSGVYVIEHPRSQIHTIIGVEPPARIAIGSYFSDRLVPGSHIGFDKEASNILYFSTSSNALIDYSIGRPPDMAGGEWAVVSELGGTLFLDSFMGMFKFDEETGLWIFYHDQMVRLSGHNLQIRSAVSEREDYHDETEHNLIENYYFFPWEAIGKFRPSSTSFPFLQLSRADIQTSLQDRYLVEPISDRQIGFNRYFEMKGFLPGGAARYMTIPSPWFMNPSVVNEMRSRDEVRVAPQQLGVWMEKVQLNGAYILASARSIVFYKTGCPFPVPIKTSNPESSFGRRPSERHVLPGMNQPGPDWSFRRTPSDIHLDMPLLSSDYIRQSDPYSHDPYGFSASFFASNFSPYDPYSVFGNPIKFLRLIRSMMYYGHVPPDITISRAHSEFVDHSLTSLAYSMPDDWYLPTYSYIKLLFFGTDEDSFCPCVGKLPDKIRLEIYSGKYADYYRAEAYIAITDDGMIVLRSGDGSVIILGDDGRIHISAYRGLSVVVGNYIYLKSLRYVRLSSRYMEIYSQCGMAIDSSFLIMTATFVGIKSFFTYFNSCTAIFRFSKFYSYNIYTYISSDGIVVDVPYAGKQVFGIDFTLFPDQPPQMYTIDNCGSILTITEFGAINYFYLSVWYDEKHNRKLKAIPVIGLFGDWYFMRIPHLCFAYPDTSSYKFAAGFVTHPGSLLNVEPGLRSPYGSVCSHIANSRSIREPLSWDHVSFISSAYSCSPSYIMDNEFSITFSAPID